MDKIATFAIVLAVAMLGFSACKKKAEHSDSPLKAAGEEAGEETHDAVHDVGQATEEAGDKVEESTD